jgi:peptidoglycan/LPS O-acetylase OafA/YrhL
MRKNRPVPGRLSPDKDLPQKIHFTQIDILKGLAIISVILIHIYSNAMLLSIGAPFYILQAVPVFLLLAAFNNGYALSLARKLSLEECYDPSILFRRLKRLVVPYLVVWVFQLLLVLWILSAGIDSALQDPNHFFYKGSDAIFNFLSGASGPGHWFIPLIIQFIFLVPFFYYLAVRSPGRMLVIAFILDLVLEYCAVLLAVPSWLYGILCIRFVFICALGVWLVFQEHVMTRWILIGGLLSALYIAAVSYGDFQFWIFSADPSIYHAFAFFWTLVIVMLGFRYLPSAPTGIITRAVAGLGKASWHIFLTQMTYFFFLGYVMTMSLSADTITIAVLIYLIPCLLIGYGFYRLSEHFKEPGKNTAP